MEDQVSFNWIDHNSVSDIYPHALTFVKVDMNLEAQNLLQFSKNFSKKKDVIFPRPYTDFTQCEVLVESFHEGSPISDYLDGHDAKLQGKLAKIGIKTILKMVNSNAIS